MVGIDLYKIDEFCIKDVEFWIKNDVLGIKNDDFNTNGQGR